MTEFRQTDATAKDFRPISLDAINFLLADVRGALGPYLNVFLVTRQHWSLSEVGLITTIGGLIALALQTPAGALIDSTRGCARRPASSIARRSRAGKIASRCSSGSDTGATMRASSCGRSTSSNSMATI
jgi:hypothetical protein